MDRTAHCRSYMGTIRYSNDPAATASFTFNGSAFVFTYLKNSVRGNIEVWLDGARVDTLNAYDPAMLWQSTYSSSGLSTDPHTVVFKHGGPSGTYIDVDAIRIIVPDLLLRAMSPA